ncbi:unnamed protein product [Phyllotreta striolata]|uniref:Uncharacterized protein n=1 Tax=Phyllotreta striolata TaxID=444603 RepID=A0A9N9XS14_PHYSR|nr:unnamed protein product [Phyllotreta striolata]
MLLVFRHNLQLIIERTTFVRDSIVGYKIGIFDRQICQFTINGYSPIHSRNLSLLEKIMAR